MNLSIMTFFQDRSSIAIVSFHSFDLFNAGSKVNIISHHTVRILASTFSDSRC